MKRGWRRQVQCLTYVILLIAGPPRLWHVPAALRSQNMQSYRVYFMCGKLIVAAEVVEARGSADAANLATVASSGVPWRKLNPDRLEVWQGAIFHLEAAIA
jgi:hypothetical protein